MTTITIAATSTTETVREMRYLSDVPGVLVGADRLGAEARAAGRDRAELRAMLARRVSLSRFGWDLPSRYPAQVSDEEVECAERGYDIEWGPESEHGWRTGTDPATDMITQLEPAEGFACLTRPHDVPIFWRWTVATTGEAWWQQPEHDGAPSRKSERMPIARAARVWEEMTADGWEPRADYHYHAGGPKPSSPPWAAEQRRTARRQAAR